MDIALKQVLIPLIALVVVGAFIAYFASDSFAQVINNFMADLITKGKSMY